MLCFLHQHCSINSSLKANYQSLMSYWASLTILISVDYWTHFGSIGSIVAIVYSDYLRGFDRGFVRGFDRGGRLDSCSITSSYLEGYLCHWAHNSCQNYSILGCYLNLKVGFRTIDRHSGPNCSGFPLTKN